MELQEQVAIVTGAGRGIGRATALELARMGAAIVAAELDQANAERTASEVRGCSGRALAVPTDRGPSCDSFVIRMRREYQDGSGFDRQLRRS